MTGYYPEVHEAIAYIHQHIHDPIDLQRLAKHVGYSPYHFIRLFKSQTGLSPYYFVTSVRLQRAKDLLLSTNYTVRDIALEIGQQSLGTFTSRFTEKVGVTPAYFREQQHHVDEQLQTLAGLAEHRQASSAWQRFQSGARIAGSIHADASFAGVIFVGLFHRPIPESLPIYGTLLMKPGDYQFAGVQPGTYYLMATSVSWGTTAANVLLPHHTLRTRSHEPIVVDCPGQSIYRQVSLHPPRLDDPPILISLPLLMRKYLAKRSAR